MDDLPKSQLDARTAGSDTYFTGQPCKHGHTAPRRTKNADCVECNKARAWAWHLAHEESVKVRLRADYLANIDKRKAQKAESYAANREKLIAQSIAWKKANPERNRASQKKNWAKNYPRHVAKEHKRRAQKQACAGSFTPKDIVDIKRLQKSKCALCKCSIKSGHHIDHIMPLALGGSNFRNNIQLLCAPCNLSKGPRHPVDHANRIGLLL